MATLAGSAGSTCSSSASLGGTYGGVAAELATRELRLPFLILWKVDHCHSFQAKQRRLVGTVVRFHWWLGYQDMAMLLAMGFAPTQHLYPNKV